jgi:hypothetical protein
MKRNLSYRLLTTAILLFFALAAIKAQPPQKVGVDSVVIYCVGTPAQVEVVKTPLRYNKDFAMSFQMDDAFVDIYNTAFSLFEGNGSTGGLYYTDGCGNSRTFKMTSDIYIFNGLNVDLLEPGPYHVPDYLTWPQLKEMWMKGWGIANHGVSDPITGHADYDIQRTQSYARRKLGDSLYIKVFVQPNQGDAFAEPAKNNHYNGFLGHGMADGLNADGHGIHVEDPAIDWLSMHKINRVFESGGYKLKADELYQYSQQGSHRWLPWGWHTTLPPAFSTELTQIYYSYGELGLDNVWVTTDEEILDYLAVKQSVTVNQEVYSNKIKLTFEGDVPSDRRYYGLTLKLKADKYIYDIKVYGTDDYSYSWIFTDSALINLGWDGKYYYSNEFLADSFTTVAMISGNQYDALVAMDYVIRMDCGKEKDSLRDLLCSLSWQGWNPTYDDGFCEEIPVNLGNDTTILKGSCLTLTAPQGDYKYQWSNGDTTATCEICPESDTSVWLYVINELGMCSADTLNIQVYNFSFSLGDDTTICKGSCVELYGPDDLAQYHWTTADTIFDTLQNTTVCPEDTTEYILEVTDADGFKTSDTIMVNILPTPDITLKPDTILNYGDCDSIIGPEGFVQYQWFENGQVYADTKDIKVCPLDTTKYVLTATTSDGCEVSDSIIYNVVRVEFSIGNDTSVCVYDSLKLMGPDNMVEYKWFANDTSVLIGTEQNIVIKPLETTYYILYVRNNIGAYGYDTIMVAVNDLPSVVISYVPGCPGNSTRVVALPYDEYEMYIWQYNNLTDTSSMGVVFFVPVAPQYVKVSVVDVHQCRNSDSVFVDFLPLPSLIAPDDTSACYLDTVTLTASGDGTIWWEDMEGNILEHSHVLKVETLEDKDYVVKDTTEQGCLAADTVAVSKIDLPDVRVSPKDTAVCQNSYLTLTGSGAENYWWDTGEGTVHADTVSLLIKDTTVIYLKGVSGEGCVNHDTAIVKAKAVPQVMAWGLLPAYCENDLPDTLTGIPEDGFFSGDGIILNIFKPSLAGAGKHRILYTFTNDEGCKGYDSLFTKVYSSGEEIDLGDLDTLRPGDTIVLDAGEGFDSYIWNTGDTTQTLTVTFDDQPAGLKHYSVVGIINACSSTGSKDILFYDPTGVDEHELTKIEVYPNPSTGEFSMKYTGTGSEARLNIYNVTGRQVRSDKIPSCHGDCVRTFEYNDLPDGLYFLELADGQKRSVIKFLISR